MSIWERKSTNVHLIFVFNLVIQISDLFHEAVWLSKKAEDTSNLSSDEFENDLKNRKFRKRKTVPLPGEEMTDGDAESCEDEQENSTHLDSNKKGTRLPLYPIPVPQPSKTPKNQNLSSSSLNFSPSSSFPTKASPQCYLNCLLLHFNKTK